MDAKPAAEGWVGGGCVGDGKKYIFEPEGCKVLRYGGGITSCFNNNIAYRYLLNILRRMSYIIMILFYSQQIMWLFLITTFGTSTRLLNLPLFFLHPTNYNVLYDCASNDIT